MFQARDVPRVELFRGGAVPEVPRVELFKGEDVPEWSCSIVKIS